MILIAYLYDTLLICTAGDSQTKMLAKIHFKTRQEFLLKGNFISSTADIHLDASFGMFAFQTLSFIIFQMYQIFSNKSLEQFLCVKKMLETFKILMAKDSYECAINLCQSILAHVLI